MYADDVAVCIVNARHHARVVGEATILVAVDQVRMEAQYQRKISYRKSYTTPVEIGRYWIMRGDGACFTPYTPECSPFALVRHRWRL
jgi:hypothetical protein